ncbi:hypothetical protein J113_17145 [Mycobacterium tuberculosis CAS/NITR204]|uniref:Uncharacterized protein n=1 Tax=Mycobacterium tuberculosis CAS/NITR204 TaxID=1310114 RepID=R4MG95_MYCTX|nr:hypothetical protein J113_17145 [Mycobacterium tuberculosis CAS/NITR204]
MGPVARGDVATIEHAELPPGWVLTTSGRISGVTEPGELSVHYPFPIADLVALDDALTYSSRACQVRFAIYLGDLGRDTAARAREILGKVPTPDNAVLLAVSPNQCAIEVVYGSQVRGRGAESAAPLGVAAASSAFEQGELVDGADERDPRAQRGDRAGLTRRARPNVRPMRRVVVQTRALAVRASRQRRSCGPATIAAPRPAPVATAGAMRAEPRGR